MINNPIIYKFLNGFTDHRKKTNWVVVFSCRTFPNILKYRDRGWDLPIIWKQDLFKQILKILASMYERSGSQFFRTTTGIQSRLDTFDESRFFMTFLIILEVTEILSNFSLLLEGKTGRDTWVIKIRVFRKPFRKQFCFIRFRRSRWIETVQQIYLCWQHYYS